LGGLVCGGGSLVNVAVWIASSRNRMVLLVLAHWMDACMAPSMPASSPAQSCMLPHASLPSSPHCIRMSLETACIQTSPMLSGRTPGCLSRATRQPWRMAPYEAHSGVVFAIQSTHSTSSSRSSAEALPCLRSWFLGDRRLHHCSQCCRGVGARPVLYLRVGSQWGLCPGPHHSQQRPSCWGPIGWGCVARDASPQGCCRRDGLFSRKRCLGQGCRHCRRR